MRYLAWLGMLLLLTLLTAPALAVRTSHWKQTNEADYKAGTLHNVVATNLGDMKLSRATRTLLEQDSRISAVYSMAEGADGTIYAGTGPEGVLLAIRDGKPETVAELGTGNNILCLLVDSHGRLLMGTGGEKGQVLALDKGEKKPKEIFSADGVQYIWAMQQTPDGNLYLATGPHGQLIEVKPDGTHSVILTSTEHNLLSMVSDGKDLLYVGTDPNGLVYRVNRQTKNIFVLYNAPESEISALALDSKGNLYAATAEAKPGLGGGKEAGAEERGGRPETKDQGVAIPSQPPKAPAPPPVPQPNPGEPPPIPKRPAASPAEPRVEGLLHSADVLPVGLFFAAPQPSPDDDPEPAPPPVAPPGPHRRPGPPSSAPQEVEPAEGAMTPTEPETPGHPKPPGNAIYRIDPDGFVTEIFRQPLMVFSLLAQNDTLLVGTGEEGLIYQVDPGAEETTVLAKVDPKEVLCLLAAKDHQIYLGLANVGGVATMSSGYATRGTFTSPVLDASQVSRFGKIQMHGSLPEGTTLTLSTRSGNVGEPDELGWSNWSDASSAAEFVQIPSPAARYLQYRLTFASDKGQVTPVVEDIDVAYEMPNMAPRIRSVKVAPQGAESAEAAEEAPAKTVSYRMQMITWEAMDPNHDSIVYTLHFRAGSSGPWILLKQDLRANQFLWDTKSVPDGRYRIRVTASDVAANSPGEGKTSSRVSDPILVDNTPPAIGDVSWKKGKEVPVELKVADRTSTVSLVEYAVDSHADWQAVEPSDSIYDSPEEKVSFTLSGLTPGMHVLTIRATDSRGNQAYENVQVTAEAPKQP